MSMSELLSRAGLKYQGRFVEVNGRRIHYLDYGEGPPVLLLHGGGAGSAIWFRQIEVLSKTHRVIAPDHPVFGLSSQKPYEAPFTSDVVRYINGFMDVLGVKSAVVVGLSLGAQMAIAVAIENPLRIHKLVVIDSAGLGKEFPLLYKLANIPVLGRMVVRPNRWGQDNYFKTMEVIDSEFEDAAAYRQYAYDVTLTPGHAAAMRSSVSVITDFGGQKSIFSDDELRSISVPLLAIWGEYDPLFPVEHGYRLASLVPNSSLHVIENTAHVPLLDRPDEVNELIEGFFGDR
ncbi:MAG: alpha/beta hydrolase [Chloroflexi bacterium]|nr:alpha/beta hydrolase [Chloroflexota bacterium]